MSLATIKNKVKDFLKEERPSTLVLKGPWGAGKTYFWDQVLSEAKESNAIHEKHYSYVSLFGINDITTFKRSIFQNSVNRSDIGTPLNLELLKKNLVAFGSGIGRKSTSLLGLIPQLSNYAESIGDATYFFTSDTLICIDDVERRGNNLNPRDFMGVLANLKEQKKCKIILILNDSDENLDEYEKYKEKLVDYEIAFNPTPEECARIGFQDFDSNLSKNAQRVGIQNIRILKQCERLYNEALKIEPNLHPQLRLQLAHSIPLLANAYFLKSSKFPSLDYILSQSYASYVDDDGDNHPEWKNILNLYGYQLSDEFDLIIAESIKRGYFEGEAFIEFTNKRSLELSNAESIAAYSRAWGVYHNTLKSAPDEVIDALDAALNVAVKSISLTNLNGQVNFARSIGYEDIADKWINDFVSANPWQKDRYDFESITMFGDTVDNKLREATENLRKQTPKTEPPNQILERITLNSSWDDEDIYVLADTSPDFFYNYFMSLNSENLGRIISTGLRIEGMRPNNTQYKSASENIRSALQRIASESNFNARKLKRFGIDPAEN